MDAMTMTQGTPITPPPDFPVVWKNPEDARYHWTRDREHNPDPITPMFSSVAALTAGPGRARAVAAYEEAILARRDYTINTYDYIRLVPFTGSPAEVEARAQRYRQKVGAVASRLRQIWENEWRPEIEAIWAFWESFDLEAADMPALAAHLDETLVHTTRLYELHYLLGSPVWFALDEFETLYCDLFPRSTRLDAHRLLQGFDNKTLESSRALWRLSRLAQTSSEVCRILTALPVAQVRAALDIFPQGRRFLRELDAFLATYGRRSNLWDWGYPSWQDDPTPVICNIRNYLVQPNRDLLAELSAAAAEREAAIARARRALTGYPAPVVERFESLLTTAQVALVLSENHTYYMDFNGFGWVRRVIREFGKRFAATRRLHDPDDVFYLTIDELQEMIDRPDLDRSAVAAGRRAEAVRWARYPAPVELGTRPAEPLYLYSADARRMLRYVGGLVADSPSPTQEPGLLHGQAGSPGRARGPARLIRTPAEADRLQPGDILVTTTTAPPWTPLFLTAAAVVTDAGGLLSHGAVVSREYRIPAVVGTHYATTRIADGQMIEVDGDRGVVYLLDGKA